MSIKVHLLHNLDGFLANWGYVSKMNASTKILKKWKKDVKEGWTLEWWQTIARVSNTTTQMPTIHTSHKKQSSYQKIPVPLWNKTLTYAIVIELLFNTNQKKFFFFLCLYSSHVLKKDKIVSFVYLEFFMYENIPERNLFTCCIAVPSHCFMTLNESPMFIVCLMNGSIYSVFPNMK